MGKESKSKKVNRIKKKKEFIFRGDLEKFKQYLKDNFESKCLT